MAAVRTSLSCRCLPDAPCTGRPASACALGLSLQHGQQALVDQDRAVRVQSLGFAEQSLLCHMPAVTLLPLPRHCLTLMHRLPTSVAQAADLTDGLWNLCAWKRAAVQHTRQLTACAKSRSLTAFSPRDIAWWPASLFHELMLSAMGVPAHKQPVILMQA